MTLKKIILRFSLFSALFVGILITDIKDSQAGVLFRNSRNVIRIGGVSSNMQQYRVRRSTQIMRSTGGNNLKARPYGGVPATMKLLVSNYKYEQKLAKWEEKKYKANIKLKQKREALAKKEAKRRELEAKRNKTKIKSGPMNTQVASNSSSSNITSAASKSGSRGSLGQTASGTANQATGPKKGFWASLVQAIFGKSK